MWEEFATVIEMGTINTVLDLLVDTWILDLPDSYSIYDRYKESILSANRSGLYIHEYYMYQDGISKSIK